MKFGMTQDLGFVTYDDTPQNFLNIKQNFNRNNYSDETAKEIDENIKKFIWQAYHRAFNFLKSHRDILEQAAKELLTKETLNEDQLKVFFQKIDHPHAPEETSSFAH